MSKRMVTIYKILFPDNTVYIGSTVDFKNRVACHKWTHDKEVLPIGKRTYLSDKLKMLGFNNCIFEKIDAIEEPKRYELETFWIEKFGDLCINRSKSAVNQNVGIKQSRKAVCKRTDTKLSRMPYFKIIKVKTGELLHITNNYESAYYVTGESMAGIRKKLRNGRNATSYRYEYLNGGGL